MKHNIVLQIHHIEKLDCKSGLMEGRVEVVYRLRLDVNTKESDVGRVATLRMMCFNKLRQTMQKLYGASRGAVPKFRHELA